MSIRRSCDIPGELDSYFAYTSANAWPYDFEKKTIIHFAFLGAERSRRTIQFMHLAEIKTLSFTEKYNIAPNGRIDESISPEFLHVDVEDLFFTHCPKKKAMVYFIQECLELYDNDH